MTYPRTVDQVAYDLQGTCQSLTEALEKHDMGEAEDDIEFCQALDELVFCCEKCGWWYEQNEMAEREDEAWICEDCTDDE